MVQKRDIIIYIILSIITCGIFSIYWFVCLTDDVNTVAGEADTSGGMALVLTIITCGIYGLYWAYRQGEKIDKAKQLRNLPAGNSGILYLILYLFGALIAFALIQNELNNLAGR
jgi:hypothetical protein